MSVELMQTLSIISFLVAGVLLLLSIALFFLLNIKKVVGDLSGSNAKKAIDKIRQQNEETGDKAHKPSLVNQSRGKVTEKIDQEGTVVLNSSNLEISVGTEKLVTDELSKAAEQVYNYSSEETTVLNRVEIAEETTVLNQNNAIFVIEKHLEFMSSSEIIE